MRIFRCKELEIYTLENKFIKNKKKGYYNNYFELSINKYYFFF
jgi:hypothetical protein